MLWVGHVRVERWLLPYSHQMVDAFTSQPRPALRWLEHLATLTLRSGETFSGSKFGLEERPCGVLGYGPKLLSENVLL